MYELVFSPRWFYGADILFEAINVVILLLLSVYALRWNKMFKDRKFWWVGLAFFLLMLSFVFKIFTNTTLYYHTFETLQIGVVQYVYKITTQSAIMERIGYFFYRMLTLFGLFILFMKLDKHEAPWHNFFIFYFLIFTSLFSIITYQFFHITAMLLFISLSWVLYKNYCCNHLVNTRNLAISFSILALSQFFLVLIDLNSLIYVVGEVVQFLGYLLLLLTFIMVLHYGKKKRTL